MHCFPVHLSCVGTALSLHLTKLHYIDQWVLKFMFNKFKKFIFFSIKISKIIKNEGDKILKNVWHKTYVFYFLIFFQHYTEMYCFLYPF